MTPPLPPPQVEPLRLVGQPLHTRTLVVDVIQAGPGALTARGSVLDLRKCGFVPTGGELQLAGFIHHMQLDAHVAQASRMLERLDVAQPVVAFEPDARTAGESCRDPAHRLQALVGEPLDAGFAKRLAASFGGALGCSHLLTLGQLLGSTLPAVLDAEEALPGEGAAPRQPGERVFRRALFLDGCERDPGHLDVGIQLTDVATAPRGQVAQPLDRFAWQHEVRVVGCVALDGMRLLHLDAAERRRGRSELASTAWRGWGDALADFVGGSALGGMAPRLLSRFGDDPAQRPLLDALLNFAPGLIQCLAALSNRMLAHVASGDRAQASAVARTFGVGGYPDSCYMWRSGGPMAALRERGEAAASAPRAAGEEDAPA